MRIEFQPHILNESGLQQAGEIAEAFSTLLTEIEHLVPPSRERSIVVTKLQEACFWAKRGMAVVPERQVK